MDFTINIPHSLGCKRASEKLQSLDGLTMRRCEAESEGDESGYRIRTKTTITADGVTVHVTGEPTRLLTRLVPVEIAQNVIESKLRKALGE